MDSKGQVNATGGPPHLLVESEVVGVRAYTYLGYAFVWILAASRPAKPWIPYGRGSENHTFARTRFFIVLAHILSPFWIRKRTQILLWLTLAALVTTKAIKICD